MTCEDFVFLSSDKREEFLKKGIQVMETPHQGAILALDMRSHVARGWCEHDSRASFIKKSA